MAISLVGTASGQAADGANVTINLPAGLQQDDLVCVWGGIPGGNSVNPGVSTSGYTEDTDLVQHPYLHCSFSYKRMGVSPDTSVTCLGDGSVFSGIAYVVM